MRDRLRLVRNEHYWDRAHVALGSMDILAATSLTTLVNLYFGGEADWVPDVPASLVARAPRASIRPTCRIRAVPRHLLLPGQHEAPDAPEREDPRRALARARPEEDRRDRARAAARRRRSASSRPGIDGWMSAVREDHDPVRARARSSRRGCASSGSPSSRRSSSSTTRTSCTRRSPSSSQLYVEGATSASPAASRGRTGPPRARRSRTSTTRSHAASWLADYADPATFLDVFTTRLRQQPDRLLRPALRRTWSSDEAREASSDAARMTVLADAERLPDRVAPDHPDLPLRHLQPREARRRRLPRERARRPLPEVPPAARPDDHGDHARSHGPPASPRCSPAPRPCATARPLLALPAAAVGLGRRDARPRLHGHVRADAHRPGRPVRRRGRHRSRDPREADPPVRPRPRRRSRSGPTRSDRSSAETSGPRSRCATSRSTRSSRQGCPGPRSSASSRSCSRSSPASRPGCSRRRAAGPPTARSWPSPSLGLALPNFVVAALLLIPFSFGLGWLPAGRLGLAGGTSCSPPSRSRRPVAAAIARLVRSRDDRAARARLRPHGAREGPLPRARAVRPRAPARAPARRRLPRAGRRRGAHRARS